jgi:uncharacterized membrane protein YbaN (DUF454 family)
MTFIVIGVASLALGGAGVVLPLLPTTPFILVAAFAFANSSETLHRWLVDHRIFGPLISDWRRHGAISRRAKKLGILSMAAILVLSLLLAVPTHVIIIQALVLGCCALFIISRPNAPNR